jgi:serine/threonine protein kinase/Tol biopolymer transport system component
MEVWRFRIPQSMIGRTITHYTVLDKLGEGGMGEVWKARDTRLDREVALKILTSANAGDPDRLRRFEAEARAVAALNHPNILSLYDVGVDEGKPFLVAELLEGRNLRQIVDNGPLPPRKTVEYGLQILAGLAAAHQKGIIHRDLKPENVFVTRDGHLKILDFGIAKTLEDERDDSETRTLRTDTAFVVGTAGYMSPEQVRGREVDARSDLFSFGALLYEMLTGRRAFEGGSAIETMHSVLSGDPPPAPGIPPALERVIYRCLEKNPEERFGSARDAAFALEAASGSSARQPAVRSWAPLWRRWWPGLAGLVLGLLLAVPLGWWLGIGRAPDPPVFRYLTYSGRDSSPAFAPDGKTLAFRSERDGTPRIWLKQVSGGSEAPLSEGPDDAPRFSPDSSEVLFARNEGDRTSLYRVPVLGGSPRRVVEDAVHGDFSPDGKQVAFVRWLVRKGRSVSVIGVVNADGSNPREIAEVPFSRVELPRWSPDGTRIAAVGSIQGGFRKNIHVATLTGKLTTLDTKRELGISGLAWLADNDTVMYVRGDYTAGAGSELIRHRLSNDSLTAVPWPHKSRCIDLSPAGLLLFDTASNRTNLREYVLDDRARGAQHWVTRGISMDRQPAYSPDGQKVLFTSDRSGSTDIWQIELPTGRLTRLVDHEAEEIDPAYGPNGIVFSSSRAGHYEIFAADPDGSRPRQITRDGVDAENATMTPDGEWIVYSSAHPERSGIWRIGSDGTRSHRLTSGTHFNPEVSPDGKYALYVSSPKPMQNLIRVVDLETGADQNFSIACDLQKPTQVVVGRARWRPDGKAIYFLGQDERGVHGVFEQEFAPGRDTTATRRPVGAFDPETVTESFAISPDGKRLLVAAWDQLASVVLAERLPGLRRPGR